MDSDIVERLHALVTDDSVDEAYTFTPPSSFINYMSPVHFGSLFSNSTDFPHMSPNSCVELQENLTNLSVDADFFKKTINPEARVAIKVLIPSGAVGPLIGKGGFFMRTLQHECYVNIVPREFAYAGSSDRVVILKGRLCSVLNVTERITSHVKERCPKANRKDVFSVEDATTYEIRIIVPNSAAELMNNENTFEAVRENAGCYAHLFPNLLSYEDGTVVNERLLVIAHDSIMNARHGVEILLETISRDPYHICEIAKLDHHFLRNGTKRNSVSQTPFKVDPSFTFPLSPNGSTNFFNNNDTTMDSSKLNKYILSFISILRAVHCTENVINEAINAIKTLAKFNALELAVSVGMQNFGLLGGPPPSNSPPNSTGNGSYVMFLQEDGETTSDMPPDTIPINRAILDVLMNETTVLSDGTDYASTIIEEFVFPDYVQLKIPERIVGAVIGPKARMLTEIQNFSRCRVQMERKDPVSSPDGMRLLNLFGDSTAVKKCRAMMEKLINEEYRRRVLRSAA